jgi:hypothetical protein
MKSDGKRHYKNTLVAVRHQRSMVALKPCSPRSPVQTRLRAMDATITSRQAGGVTGRRFDFSSHRQQCTKKNELKPWLVQRWCLGHITGDYIWHMEDILSLYEEPYDRLWPVICFDERLCQLIGDVLAPLPMKPGRSKRQDYEYARNGTCGVLLAVEPLRGWRYIQVRQRRTAIDYAAFMKELVETYYPSVEVIRLVQDNLNTHTSGSFYYAFTPSEGLLLPKNLNGIRPRLKPVG